MAHAADRFPSKTVDVRKSARTGMPGFPLSYSPDRPIPFVTRVGFASADILSSLRRHAFDPFREVAASAVDACIPMINKTVDATVHAGRRAKELKEKRPLQLLGVIAGSAFVLGFALRLWRSTHDG